MVSNFGERVVHFLSLKFPDEQLHRTIGLMACRYASRPEDGSKGRKASAAQRRDVVKFKKK